MVTASDYNATPVETKKALSSLLRLTSGSVSTLVVEFVLNCGYFGYGTLSVVITDIQLVSSIFS